MHGATRHELARVPSDHITPAPGSSLRATHGRGRWAHRLAVALVAATVLGVPAVAASAAQPTGPGQPVEQPAAECPGTISCTYGERNFLPNGYRVQKLEVCGANCTSQYWVSLMADGTALVTTDPVRGGGVVAVGQPAGSQDPHPPVRLVLPDYQQGDAACCPSQYADTTYTWDAAAGTLVAGEPDIIPATDFAGWDALRANLQSDHFVVVFP